MIGHSHVKGALYVQFDVKFPETIQLTDAMKKVRAVAVMKPATRLSNSEQRVVCSPFGCIRVCFPCC